MKTSKQHKAYKAIKEMLKDPDTIRNVSISESDIARKLQMSRTPIRKALQKLSDEGLIFSKDHLGMMIKRPSFTDLKECCETRLAMETFILGKICPNLSSEDLSRLQNIMESQALAVEHENHSLFGDTDREFHRSFFRVFGNRFMLEVYENIKDKLAGTDMEAYRIPGKLPFIYEEHINILDALRSRNSEKAIRALGIHLGNFKNKYFRFPDPTIYPPASSAVENFSEYMV